MYYMKKRSTFTSTFHNDVRASFLCSKSSDYYKTIRASTAALDNRSSKIAKLQETENFFSGKITVVDDEIVLLRSYPIEFTMQCILAR